MKKILSRGRVNLVKLVKLLKKYILNYLSDFGWKKNKKKLILVSASEIKTDYMIWKILMYTVKLEHSVDRKRIFPTHRFLILPRLSTKRSASLKRRKWKIWWRISTPSWICVLIWWSRLRNCAVKSRQIGSSWQILSSNWTPSKKARRGNSSDSTFSISFWCPCSLACLPD